MSFRITIFQKLLLGFSILLVLTAIVAFVSVQSLMRTNDLVDNVIHGSVKIKTATLRIESEFRSAVTHEQHFLIHLDTASILKFKASIDKAQENVWTIIRRDSTGLGNERDIVITRKAAELQRMIDQYFRGFSDIVWEISTRAEKRHASFSEILRSDSTIKAQYENYSAKAIRAWTLSAEIVYESDKSTEIVLMRLAETRLHTVQLLGILSICALCLGIALAFTISRRFSAPIIEIRNAAQKVASGMRSIQVNIKSGDELEDLGKSFNSMANNLDKMFTDIEEMFVELEDKSLELAMANEQNQALLLNVLPKNIAERLKAGETLIADEHEEATILFADMVGFTQLSAKIPAVQIVEMLNWIFSVYDDLTHKYGLEKIKTIGDAYMVAGGVPLSTPNHCKAVAEMGVAIIRETKIFAEQSGIDINVRVGIHTGQVVAGVIGQKKFIYDLWGDTVNTASRMESSGEKGQVHISEAVYQALKLYPEDFTFEERGEIDVKGKGKMRTYFLHQAIEK